MATPTTLPASFVAGAVLEAAQLNNLRGAFRVLQVVSTTKTNTFTSTSTSFADITGLSVSITPSATSSKVLVMANVCLSHATAGNAGAIQLVRDSTAICIGDADGSRTRASYGFIQPAFAAGYATQLTGVAVILDSPNTTSATTYKVQIDTSGGTVVVNRDGDNQNTADNYRTASSITVMEISA